jgi:hypothetical protein
MLSELSAAEAEYLLVGGYALAGVEIPVIGKADFINNKKLSGRPKDLADLACLEQD